MTDARTPSAKGAKRRKALSTPPRTERERMLAGEEYNSRDPELLDTAHRARGLLAAYNATPSTDALQRRAILTMLLREVDVGVWIEPPFFCDYGTQVRIGANSFVNANCVFLDSAWITIGANVLLGPGVQLLTATHPLRASDRLVPGWTPESGQAPYRTSAQPITIGDNCWIGAGTLVMPGVTIGANTTIGAGSMVTHDIPADVLAFGQPCRVIRAL
jgi:maltose O-acetyltransferase